MSERAHRGWVWTGAAAVAVWRVAAFIFPHAADTDPQAVRNALAVMGLWFVACGVWAALRAPGRDARLFAAYGLASGVHWGGPVGFGPPAVQNLLLAIYIVVSTALVQGLFLHLALAFPDRRLAKRNRGALWLVYLPVLAGGVLLLALCVRPLQPGLLDAVGLLFPLGVLYSLAAGVVWIRRWLLADPEQRRAHRLGLLVTVMIGAWLPHAAVSALGPFRPPYDGLFNLPLSAIPAVLALSVVSARAWSAEDPARVR